MEEDESDGGNRDWKVRWREGGGGRSKRGKQKEKGKEKEKDKDKKKEKEKAKEKETLMASTLSNSATSCSPLTSWDKRPI